MAAGDTAVAFAVAQEGKPYRWGGTGPDAYDCSGLAQAAWQAAGVALPRTTFGQIAVGVPVAQADLLPGDLVFPDPDHVQIFKGSGIIVEAPHTGANVREGPMWGFMAARRVGAPGSGTATPATATLVGSSGPDLSGIGAIGSTATHIFGWITNLHNILRLVEVAAGVGIILAGLAILERDTLATGAGKLVHLGLEVA